MEREKLNGKKAKGNYLYKFSYAGGFKDDMKDGKGVFKWSDGDW